MFKINENYLKLPGSMPGKRSGLQDISGCGEFYHRRE